MTKKVKLAIFDRDLKARTVGTFPVSKDGSRISVRKGGKRNFNPTFDNESYIDFPKRFGGWTRTYFVRNGAKECVNFKTGSVSGPDPDLVIEAAESAILQNIGKDKEETPLISWLTLGAVILLALKVFGVIV